MKGHMLHQFDLTLLFSGTKSSEEGQEYLLEMISALLVSFII